MSWYGRRKIRNVKGGIRAQSRRGSFGDSWWAKRWNAVLDGYDIGERLSRGRTYARRGQVASIKIARGSVTAVVHGSYVYKVAIGIRALEAAQRKAVSDGIFSRPATAAKLLSGQMPDDIEDVFESSGLGLFPSAGDLDTDCTCPDWSNPCKHIAAVYLLLGEEFDRDPFLIFRLRGVERDELLKMAGLDAGVSAPPGRKKARLAARRPRAVPLVADPLEFWGRYVEGDGEEADGDRGRPGDRLGDAIVPAVPAAAVKQLGSFPFWRGEDNFIPSMEEIYRDASEIGVRVFLGEPPEPG
ncbi:MAG: SWIM zinc finger family protein [Nitrosopumilaceae archaeon]|nr:SWIM zinc finger family protein [Nitrosopumilaceae archaeon]